MPNPFDDDGDLDDQQDQGSEALKSAREHISRLEKELRKRDSRIAEFEKGQRSSTAKAVFDQLEMDQRQVDLFLATHPEGDVNEETVKAFASQYGLGLKEAAPVAEVELTEEDEVPNPSTPQVGVTPPVTGAFTPVTGSAGTEPKMDYAEWKKEYTRNPQHALQLVAMDRVNMPE